MSDFYLVAYHRTRNTCMDFYLRSEDGVLLVDDAERETPFLVEPEAVLALLTYLEERKDIILQAQKSLMQQGIDLKEDVPDADVSLCFELLPVPKEGK